MEEMRTPLTDIQPDEVDAWSRFAAAALARDTSNWTAAAARADMLLTELRKRRPRSSTGDTLLGHKQL